MAARAEVAVSAWSPQQRQWLDAIGLDVLRLRAEAGAQADQSPVGDPKHADPGGAATQGLDFEHPLFPALVRAAALEPHRPSEFDWAGWARELAVPALARLAVDPAAKRALWRRLRGARVRGRRSS